MVLLVLVMRNDNVFPIKLKGTHESANQNSRVAGIRESDMRIIQTSEYTPECTCVLQPILKQ